MEERRMKEMAAEAEHATRRFELYRARVHASKPSSPARLRALKRRADRAKLALHRTRAGE